MVIHHRQTGLLTTKRESGHYECGQPQDDIIAGKENAYANPNPENVCVDDRRREDETEAAMFRVLDEVVRQARTNPQRKRRGRVGNRAANGDDAYYGL